MPVQRAALRVQLAAALRVQLAAALRVQLAVATLAQSAAATPAPAAAMNPPVPVQCSDHFHHWDPSCYLPTEDRRDRCLRREVQQEAECSGVRSASAAP
jgi:hypothetical protein